MTAGSLAGRVAVVTGGSRGLGLAMARAFADAGADVVVASRKLDSCERAASAITAATGRTAVPVVCHVGRWADLDALVDASYAAFDHVDVLVNNAGPFLTDISKSWDLEGFEHRARNFPLRRGGQPDEIVGAALYFAGDASSFTTGSVLSVDGGASLA